jgi:5-methylcytosine-specific restriction endonuclease McrA
MLNKLQLVESLEEVKKNVIQFNHDVEANEEMRKRFLSHFKQWYYIKEIDMFAPSKFIGYKEMNGDRYNNKDGTGADGRKTELALKNWFTKKDVPELLTELQERMGSYGKIKKNSQIHILKSEEQYFPIETGDSTAQTDSEYINEKNSPKVIKPAVNLKGNAKADLLFNSLIQNIKSRGIDTNKEFTVEEIGELIPLGTAGVNNPATYRYSMTSMFSKQKGRDYFIFQHPEIQHELTLLANNPKRNNSYWRTNYSNQKLMINPKYTGWTNSVKSFSWEVLSDFIAFKGLDKSVFIHNGTGIPKEIRNFFGVEGLGNKEKVEINIIHEQVEYSARIEMDNQPSPRSRMMWKADFSNVIKSNFPNEYSTFLENEKTSDEIGAKLKFTKVSRAVNTYKVEFVTPISGQVIQNDLEAEDVEHNGPERAEGNAVMYYGRRYERNPINRKLALEYHGYSCVACGFNFEKAYGERGKEYIEVHHVKPLSTLKAEMVIDPKKDLVPLCSNCHRMVHRKKDDVLSIEDLQGLLNVNMK